MRSSDTLWSFEPILREIAKLRRALTRRRWVFVAAASLPIAATCLYVTRAPNRYEGTAKVIIGKSADEAAFSFTPDWTPQGKELENQLEQVKSHEVISAAAALGRKRYPQDQPSEEEIRRAFSVKPLKGTDIIEVRAVALNPARAAALANLVADAYIEAHLADRRKRAANRKGFIEDQVSLYEQRLRASERTLEDYKRLAGVTALGAETTELIRMDATYRVDLEKTRVDLAVAERRQRYYEDELVATRNRLLADATDVSSPVARQLQEKLVSLEYRYANLILKGYSPDHAELTALRREIADTRLKLAADVSDLGGTETGLNPFARIETMAGELDVSRAETVALRTRRNRLEETAAGANVLLAAIPEKESTLGDLIRDKESNEKIYTLLLEKREEARIEVAAEIGTARFFSRAIPPEKPFAPRRGQSIILGILMGLFVGGAAVSVVEYFDRTVKTTSRAGEIMGTLVLGAIPRFTTNGGGDHYLYNRDKPNQLPSAAQSGLPIVVRAPKSPTAEALRAIYAQIVYRYNQNGGAKNITLGFTSSWPQEGKSTISSNLACSFAQFGLKTLIIDADLNRYSLGKIFGMENRIGLAEYLRKEAAFDDIILDPGVPNLSLVTAGTNPTEPPALLASSLFADFVQRAKKEFDVVLVDVPPVSPVADVALTAATIKDFVFVVRAGAVNPAELERSVTTLRQVGGQVIGVILNGADFGETYGNYRYHHYYYYGERAGERTETAGSKAKG